jgi:hypothetical protein
MLTEEQAALEAISETKYCYILKRVFEYGEKDSVCLERIYVKSEKIEEIRLSFWKKNKFMPRPGTVDVRGWVPLLKKALDEGIFSKEEQCEMLAVLALSVLSKE